MQTVVRFLAILLLSLLLVGAFAYFHQARQNQRILEDQLSSLQSRLAELREYRTKLNREQARSRETMLLMKQTEDAGLTPEQWYRYPLGINRRLAWVEVEKLLGTVSSADSLQQGYLFSPNLFSLQRVPRGDGEDQSSSEPTSSDHGAMFRTELTGVFHIQRSMHR